MAQTLQHVIDIARELLKDEDASEYRYTDAELLRAINTCVTVVYSKRPDAFNVVRDGIPFYATADLANEFEMPLQFFNPFVFFVTGYAELRNDEFTDDSRARALIGKFSVDITGDTDGAA